MIVGAVVAGGLSVATWHEQWLLVLTLPAAAVGVLFAHNGGGPTDLQQSLLPPGIRLGLAVLGVVAVAVIYLAGFINGWVAMIEIPAAAAAVVLTLAVMQAPARPSTKETP
jgi:prepilin signal peptidase PulO-like enzyme (type II secretory pathway)